MTSPTALTSTSAVLNCPVWRRFTLAHLLLAVITLLAAGLHLANLSALGDANAYYSAAVKSMLHSWHNFFFLAAEPGGSVTVDKPPLGLWVEVPFALLFGVHGWSVSLPNMLAGIASVPLLYALVKQHLGELAGLVAALVLTVTPVFLATNRNNTMDGFLVFLLLLAAWAFLEAAATNRLRWLLLGGLLLGLGFETKMLQAFLPLPAFFALYFFGAQARWEAKIRKLAAAAAVILVVGLAWPLAVDLTPPESRPYVGSSNDNTVMGLIIGHNGLARLFHPRGNFTKHPPGVYEAPPRRGSPPPEALEACRGLAAGEACTVSLPRGEAVHGTCIPYPGGEALVCAPPKDASPPPDGQGGPPRLPPGAQPPTGAAPQAIGGVPFGRETGAPGPLRFFRAPLAKQMSWLLPFGLLGVVLLAFASPPRWPLTAEHQALVLWGGWLVTCLLFFSAVEGIFHAYYVAMLAPPLGAMVGAGFAWFWERLAQAAARWGLALAATGTVAFQLFAAYQEGANTGWFWLAPVLVLLGGLALAFPRARRTGALAALASMLLIPAVWTGWTVFAPSFYVNLPTAYTPRAAPQAPSQTHLTPTTQVLDYLRRHPPGTFYLIAVPSAQVGAPLVLATDQPVLYMGGFGGHDPVVDAEGLAALVAEGKLRYVLYYARNARRDIQEWLRTACQPLPGLKIQGHGQPMQLYDCRR